MRAFRELKRIATNTGNEISLSEAKEATEEFISHCYHFKDWLIKEHPSLKQKVEDHISGSVALSLAADICNSYKHAGLDRTPRSGKDLEGVLQHTKVDLTPQGFVSSAEVEVKAGGISYKGMDLAEECIRDWDTFLANEGISIPPP